MTPKEPMRMAHSQQIWGYYDAQGTIDPQLVMRRSPSTRSSPARMVSPTRTAPYSPRESYPVNPPSFGGSSVNRFDGNGLTSPSAGYTREAWAGSRPVSPPSVESRQPQWDDFDLASGDGSEIMEPILVDPPRAKDSYLEPTPQAAAINSPAFQSDRAHSPRSAPNSTYDTQDPVPQADDDYARAQRVQQNALAVGLLRTFLTHGPNRPPNEQELVGFQLLCNEPREDLLSWLNFCGHDLARLEKSSHCGSDGARCSGRRNKTSNPRFQFPCPDCDYSSRKKGDLKRHMEQKSPPGKYTCEECGKIFYRRDKFKAHMEKAHKRYNLAEEEIDSCCVLLEQHFPSSCDLCTTQLFTHETWEAYFNHWVEYHCRRKDRSDGSVTSQAPALQEHAQPMVPSFSNGSVHTYPPGRNQLPGSHRSFANASSLQGGGIFGTRRSGNHHSTQGHDAFSRQATQSQNPYPSRVVGYLESRRGDFPDKLLHNDSLSTRAAFDRQVRAREAVRGVEGRF